MLFQQLALVTLLVLGAQAYGGGGGGYGGSRGGGGGYGGSPVPLSIQSYHNVKYYSVPSSGYAKPVSIEIGASHIPVNFLFRSASSNLNVQQYHQGAQGSNQESQSEDEAHYLKHTVKKPVYQEVREIVSPYRKITQEVLPVNEEILTSIAKGTQKSYGGSAGYGGGNSARYSGGSQGGY